MDIYGFTEYFENEVLRKRPYLKKEWCIRIIENPLRWSRRKTIVFDSGVWWMILKDVC